MLRETSWESISQNLAAVRRLRPPLAPLADALEPVLARVHREAREAPSPEILLVEPEVRNGRGLPLLPRVEFPIDLHAGVRLFRELVVEVSEKPTSDQRAASSLKEQAQDPDWVKGLLRAFAAGELEAAAAGGSNAGDLQELTFFARMALLPGLEAGAAHLGASVSPAWGGATCPVCGTKPRLTELRAPEGRRHLHCAFCHFSWPYAATGCPNCGTQQPDGINLLYIEDDRRSRLEICQGCRTYIKCIDNKEFFGIVPLVEDLLSPHLDILAVEKDLQPIVS
ncbi:MAG TPA: formate dehydrogenase accessory protein FdhE [Candidatus Methylomirabilis sp.]|nr:formate dehydrogenase accessory protein FdhE [Candidatus Methylomirabilis sp.]